MCLCIENKLYCINYLPVNPGDTFLYNAPNLLEHIGVFLIHPVGQIPSIIQYLGQ